MLSDKPPISSASDESELLIRLRQRDRAAFDTLFERYSGRVLAFARQLTGSTVEAEDLVQETFVALFQQVERYRGDSRFLTYLLGITVRRYRDRKRKPAIAVVALQEETDTTAIGESPSPEHTVLASVAFDAAFSRLDHSLKTAFVLVVSQGLTHREAADVLQAPVGTVKWRVAEASKRLRIALQEEELSDAQSHPPVPVPVLPRR